MIETSPISLYVHIPFCVKKCLFCSFAVAIGQSHRMDDYIGALEREAFSFKGRVLKTIYLGGGTPSFLSVEQIKRTVDVIKANFEILPDAEWTIESNPEGMDAEKAIALKSLGFTRISLGVQSFNDAHLKFLGRAHDRTQALRAFSILRDAGFDNINVDLMYGFPKETREDLQDDLKMVTGLNSEHVSVYTLTIEPNSRFYAKQMKLDSDDKLADDYVFVSNHLEQAGIMQYEVSNFAKPGFESMHNSMYWQGGDYIGLGMGAHSLMGSRRFWNTSVLKDYLEDIEARGNAVIDGEDLSVETRFMERVIFGLRMNKGVKIGMIEQEFGMPLMSDRQMLINEFNRDGFLIEQNGCIQTTEQGRLVLDQLCARLI